MKDKRRMSVLIAVGLAVVVCYVVQFDGSLHPVGRALAVSIESSTLVTPTAVINDQDQDAVYVVLGGPRTDGRFDTSRVDARTGQQSRVGIALGPQSGFSPLVEGEVRLAVTGLSIRRPVFHLLRFPGGGGPGFHLVDSDTGLAKLSIGTGATERTLITRWVFNSSAGAELRSLAATDAKGKYIAVISRTPPGWTLYLFDRVIAAAGPHST